jgi:Sulfotransferase family
MPYFKNWDIFYLHVPKTGGTSIEDYFYSKLGAMFRQRHEDTMYGMFLNQSMRIEVPNGRSLHHLTYREILSHLNCLGPVFAKEGMAGVDVFRQLNFKYVVVSVRNPFDRIISEIIWRKRIQNKDVSSITPELIETRIEEFLYQGTNDSLDNHRLPQYQFILDESGNPIQNIHIVKQETLTQDMRALGFTDFSMYKNKNTIEIDYRSLFTLKAADMVRKYYAEDFAYFGYSTELKG